MQKNTAAHRFWGFSVLALLIVGIFFLLSSPSARSDTSSVHAVVDTDNFRDAELHRTVWENCNATCQSSLSEFQLGSSVTRWQCEGTDCGHAEE